MTSFKLSSIAITFIAAALSTAALAETAAKPVTQPTAPVNSARIVVSLEDRKLALIENGQVKKIYTVAVGKPSTPSPNGTFTIERRVVNPTYSHDGRIVPPGPGNPVGTRWMGLSIPGYGIHGTNVPSSIGKAASHGCIRMARTDLEELYPQVSVGTTVELIGQRNDETAQLFAVPQIPARQPAVMANAAPAAQPDQLAVASTFLVKVATTLASTMVITGTF
jgi:lipoprotein-anchoring transpeptidase ErfK/SrfK